MIRSVLIFSFFILSTFQISQTERCFLKVLRGDLTNDSKIEESNFDSDEEILKDISIDYQMMPIKMQEELKECGKALADSSCELKYGQNMCEDCGLARVRKCEDGYTRFDCLSCVKTCPHRTEKADGGALCLKPKVIHRKNFLTKEACLNTNKNCIMNGETFISDCPDFFKPLGPLRCTYDCGQGYTDGIEYCIPERSEYPVIFPLKFEQTYKRVISFEH